MDTVTTEGEFFADYAESVFSRLTEDRLAILRALFEASHGGIDSLSSQVTATILPTNIPADGDKASEEDAKGGAENASRLSMADAKMAAKTIPVTSIVLSLKACLNRLVYVLFDIPLLLRLLELLGDMSPATVSLPSCFVSAAIAAAATV